jgi:mannose-6-phosphate isomerase-like protein (cupin superfamily)
MERKQFINGLSLIAACLTIPIISVANSFTKFRQKKGYKIDAGKDREEKPMHLFEGDTFYTKVASADTDGDMYVYESTRVKKGGPNLHMHPDQDEWWFILEGEFIIKVGDQVYEVRAGDSVFGPRGVPHTFTKLGDDGVGRMLTTFQPAGKMEACFQAISNGAMKGRTEAEQDEFRKQHGFIRVGPPLNYLKKL